MKKLHRWLLSLALVATASADARSEPRKIDLSSKWDASLPLANPHKGWYHHYYDNGLQKYLPRRDEDLTSFPGMDHIYLRLAWSYLEPEEGRYNWKVIDEVIEKWTGLGLMISFRISCRETGTHPIEQKFATPRWVIAAGARGGHYRRSEKPGNPEFPWEPVYDDPVFLEKLEGFIRAFASRYDGKPWLRYVDIGSLGDWGEGHTSSGSNMKYDWKSRLKHLELHTRHFKKSLLVVSDDFVRGAPSEEGRQKLHRYVVDHGISYRDDSILVDYWVGECGKTFSVANPGYFEDVYRKTPTVLELQHLRNFKKDGSWESTEGSRIARFDSTGPEFFRGAIRLMRATYIGYHGYVHEWMALSGNPGLTTELLNLCGYWYFPHSVEIPDELRLGSTPTISIQWENRGVAPAYHSYQLRLQLKGPVTRTITVDSGNRRWLPGQAEPFTTEKYALALPDDLKPGKYDLSFQLYCKEEKRPVLLPLRSDLMDRERFYAIDSIAVR